MILSSETVARIKHLQSTFLQNTDTCTCCGLHTIFTILQKPVISNLHYMFMTWYSDQKMEAMQVESRLGEEATRLVAAVEDWVSKFASVSPLNIFKDTVTISSCWHPTKLDDCNKNSRHLKLCLHSQKQAFNAKTQSFSRTLTKCQNLPINQPIIISKVLSRHKIANWT